MSSTIGKVGYGTVFCVGVPLLLATWAWRMDLKFSTLPAVHAPAAGWLLALAGVGLMLRAMWDLWRRGGGLPMNAFPPPRFVHAGAYRWLAHPIYVGFGLLVPGAAIAVGSPAGVWLVTPLTWLTLLALVVGYERIDLQRRFGSPAPRPLLALPAGGDEPPSWSQKIVVLLFAFGPWLLGYEASVRWFVAIENPVNTMLPVERSWPVGESWAVFYLGAYAWTAFAPFALQTTREARRFIRAAWCGTGFILWCFWVFPFVSVPRTLDQTSVFGRWLAADRSLDAAACAFPSFHVFWAFLAADLWAARLGRTLSGSIAIAIAVSCVTTGTHSVLDVAAGWIVYLGARRHEQLWLALRNATERIANSWRDWRFGAARIINHGGYVAAATTLGLWCVGLLLGREHTAGIVTVALCGVLGAGVWGQWLEASSQLSRPFGYFGGFFGSCVGAALAHVWWGTGWQLAGAFAVGAPVIQAIGRFRCLVQGCCHGRPVTIEVLGIRYTQPLSRVCKLAGLAGVPVHATPLYSILGNVVILGLLLRLWRDGADLAFITGAYLMLSTCARFMEEGYRGEPQTVRWAGLPIYQWLAVGCLLAGLGVASLPSPVAPAAHFSFQPLLYAVPLGLLVWGAMGVDFPESNRRMSRLA